MSSVDSLQGIASSTEASVFRDAITIPTWNDAHCHLGFLEPAERAAAEGALKTRGFCVFSNTVTPDEFRAMEPFQGSHVDVGLGLHPRFVDIRFESQLTAFDELLPITHFVGEVGLDFGNAFVESADAQRRVFSHIAHACAEAGGKILSIHAVRAAGEVLDILEQSGAVETCALIMHWFSGSSDELTRALELGCFFSIGPRMLETRRGRAYAKSLPRERILPETDYPPIPNSPLGSLDELCDTIAHAASLLETVRA